MRSMLALAVLSSLAVAANAEPMPVRPEAHQTAERSRMVTDDCARARKAGKTCELSLPPEDVGGSSVGPNDINPRILQLVPMGSLIRVRRDFIVEIVTSAEDQ